MTRDIGWNLKPVNQSWRTKQVAAYIRPWIEERAQVTGFSDMVASGVSPRNRATEKYDRVLPKQWRKYHSFHEIARNEKPPTAKLQLQVGQAALLSCQTAWEAFVWRGVESGLTAEKAHQASFDVLNPYVRSVITGQDSPPAYSALGFKDVRDSVNTVVFSVEAYGKSRATLTSMAGLAITALTEQAELAHTIRIPDPAKENPVEWDYNPSILG